MIFVRNKENKSRSSGDEVEENSDGPKNYWEKPVPAEAMGRARAKTFRLALRLASSTVANSFLARLWSASTHLSFEASMGVNVEHLRMTSKAAVVRRWSRSVRSGRHVLGRVRCAARTKGRKIA